MTDVLAFLGAKTAAHFTSERGASAVEYGLLVALIAIMIVLAVSLLGTSLSNILIRTASSTGS